MTTLLVEQKRAVHVTSGRAESSAYRYLAVFLLTCLVLYAAPFLFERVTAVQPYAASDWGLVLDHGYNLAGTDADIVIFGDSSALYGVDTPLLSAALGLKVINLPQSIGSLVVTGDLPLRRYLRQNKQPRLLVFYFSPWDRDFDAVADAHDYEGLEQMVRHGTPLELLRLVLKRPTQVLTFPLAFYRVPSGITRFNFSAGTHLAPRDGFLPYPGGAYGPLSADCVIPQRLLDLKSDRSLLRLHAAFNGVDTVSILAPLPLCSGVEQASMRLGGRLLTLPPQHFAADGMLVHPLADEAATTTDRVAGIVHQHLTHAR